MVQRQTLVLKIALRVAGFTFGFAALGAKPALVKAAKPVPKKAAEAAVTQAPEPSVDKIFFNKAFDFGTFYKAEASASMGDLLALIGKNDVDVFGVDTDPALPAPPAAVAEEWKKYENGDLEKGLPLHGIFFRKDHPFQKFQATKDLIVLHGKLVKPIVVHEFAHALFQKARFVKSGYQSEFALNKAKTETSDQFISLVSDPLANVDGIAKAGMKMVPAVDESLKAASLEEAVVGYYVASSYLDGKLDIMPDEAMEHVQHAATNIEMSRRPYRAYNQLLAKLYQEAFDPLVKRVQQSESKINELDAALKDVREKILKKTTKPN